MTSKRKKITNYLIKKFSSKSIKECQSEDNNGKQLIFENNLLKNSMDLKLGNDNVEEIGIKKLSRSTSSCTDHVLTPFDDNKRIDTLLRTKSFSEFKPPVPPKPIRKIFANGRGDDEDSSVGRTQSCSSSKSCRYSVEEYQFKNCLDEDFEQRFDDLLIDDEKYDADYMKKSKKTNKIDTRNYFQVDDSLNEQIHRGKKKKTDVIKYLENIIGKHNIDLKHKFKNLGHPANDNRISDGTASGILNTKTCSSYSTSGSINHDFRLLTSKHRTYSQPCLDQEISEHEKCLQLGTDRKIIKDFDSSDRQQQVLKKSESVLSLVSIGDFASQVVDVVQQKYKSSNVKVGRGKRLEEKSCQTFCSNKETEFHSLVDGNPMDNMKGCVPFSGNMIPIRLRNHSNIEKILSTKLEEIQLNNKRFGGGKKDRNNGMKPEGDVKKFKSKVNVLDRACVKENNKETEGLRVVVNLDGKKKDHEDDHDDTIELENERVGEEKKIILPQEKFYKYKISAEEDKHCLKDTWNKDEKFEWQRSTDNPQPLAYSNKLELNNKNIVNIQQNYISHDMNQVTKKVIYSQAHDENRVYSYNNNGTFNCSNHNNSTVCLCSCSNLSTCTSNSSSSSLSMSGCGAFCHLSHDASQNSKPVSCCFKDIIGIHNRHKYHGNALLDKPLPVLSTFLPKPATERFNNTKCSSIFCNLNDNFNKINNVEMTKEIHPHQHFRCKENGSSSVNDAVDFESIIQRKEATKEYWETLMRLENNKSQDPPKLQPSLNKNIKHEGKDITEGCQSKLIITNEHKEEDAGFESYQQENSTDMEDLKVYESGVASPDQGISLSLNENDTIPFRATFSQKQQNIPHDDLKQKASNVLDLINSEISDLHLRELELKRNLMERNNQFNSKNPSDSKSNNNSTSNSNKNNSASSSCGSTSSDDQDRVDDDEYHSDSAVDFESYSCNSGSPGNITPSEKYKNDQPCTIPFNDKFNKHSDICDDRHEPHDDGPININKLESTSNSRSNEPIKRRVSIKSVKPLVEDESESLSTEFMSSTETPIEREIRISREREEEFRRLKSLPSLEQNDHIVSTEYNDDVFEDAEEKRKESEMEKCDKETDGSGTEKCEDNVSRNSNEDCQGKNNIEYEMATARLHKEIEEQEAREKEILSLRKYKIHCDIDNNQSQDEENTEPMKNDELEIEHNILPSQGRKQLTASMSSQSSVNKSPILGTTRFFAPTGYNNNRKRSSTISSVSSPRNSVSSFDNSFTEDKSKDKVLSTPSAFITGFKPSFNAIERFIMKNSRGVSIGANFDVEGEAGLTSSKNERRNSNEAKHEEISVDSRKVKEFSSGSEKNEGEEGGETKVRRKYEKTEDKILRELKEMEVREKELTKMRERWKSTPDLASANSEEEENVKNVQLELIDSSTGNGYGSKKGSVSLMRNKFGGSTSDVLDIPRGGRPVKRRQSALVSKWEEIIKKYQK